MKDVMPVRLTQINAANCTKSNLMVSTTDDHTESIRSLALIGDVHAPLSTLDYG